MTTWKRAAIILAVALTFWAGFKFREATGSALTVLPLSGGSAIYVRANGEHTLIDCGDDDNARWITKPFLQAQGVNRLSHLVLTHGDVRHVGAAPQIHRYFSPANTYFSEVRSRSLPYKEALQHLQERQAPTKTVAAGDRIGSWQVLHPARGESFARADDNAVVLLCNLSGKRVLLLSDLGQEGQNALINRNPQLRADIVVTGLPVQGEPVTDGFLDAVQPGVVIVCDAEFPARERAPEHLKARLAQRSMKVIYTREFAAQLTF